MASRDQERRNEIARSLGYSSYAERRKLEGIARGLSPSQARGHARSHTEADAEGRKVTIYDEVPAALVSKVGRLGKANVIQSGGGRTVLAAGKGKGRTSVYISPELEADLPDFLDTYDVDLEETPT